VPAAALPFLLTRWTGNQRASEVGLGDSPDASPVSDDALEFGEQVKPGRRPTIHIAMDDKFIMSLGDQTRQVVPTPRLVHATESSDPYYGCRLHLIYSVDGWYVVHSASGGTFAETVLHTDRLLTPKVMKTPPSFCICLMR